MSNNVAGAQAVIRAIQLLKRFDDAHPTWELAALSEATELNKTTVFRILSALENEGLIERTATGAYRLGSEMIALGGRAARANELRRVAHTHLEALAQTTGETVTLEILRADADGNWHMLVIDEVLGRHLVGITQYIGSRLPVYATSTGKAVLAFLDDEQRQTVLHESLKADGGGTLPATATALREPDDWQQTIATIQARGYALATGELEMGVMAVGVPIFDYNGVPQAALSVVGPSIRVQAEHLPRLATHATRSASVISHQLGYRAHP